MSKKQINIEPKDQHKKTILLIGLLIVLSLISWAVDNPQKIRDWYILQTYSPPASIVNIANQDGMSPYAKSLFYVNRPNIASKSAFAKECPNLDTQTYVIGCYHSGDNGIYILDVVNKSLIGIIPVTAAYEMLHAGYARLSSNQKAILDKTMWNFYLNNVHASQIKQQMASYAKTEPGARYDELYSVLATEVNNLPTSLTQDYKAYFSDRKLIVKMYDNYQAAISYRNNQIKTLNTTLTSLKSQINSDKLTLSNEHSTIVSDTNNLNNFKSTNNIVAYNQEVPNYNSLVNGYNNLANEYRSLIGQYNHLVNDINSLVLQQQQLVSSLQSSAP